MNDYQQYTCPRLNVLETKRLYLRNMTQDDDMALCRILQDKEVMYAYEGAFDDAMVQEWLEKQLNRYKQDGIGLWMVVRKEDGVCIGQCGLTYQTLGKQTYLEVGYLFAKAYWHQGYATEAAHACIEYAFQSLHVDAIYSIIRSSNQASIQVAKRNQMQCVDHYMKHYRGVDMMHDVYKIEKKNYRNYSFQNENNI